jgi:hypothetical protein
VNYNTPRQHGRAFKYIILIETARCMNQHEHSASHGHSHSHKKPGWKPHRDWRVWVVVAMLAAMVIYVLTLDESFFPGGDGEPVPAAPAAGDAP